MIKWSLVTLVGLTFLVFVPAFNWMYCCNHSYSKWANGGVVEATLHGIAWPVYGKDLMLKPTYYVKEALCSLAGAICIAGKRDLDQLSNEEKDRMAVFMDQALLTARKANYEALNGAFPGLGDHFQTEFIKGVERFRDGLRAHDELVLERGIYFLSLWSKWCQDNMPSLELQA